MSTQATPSTTSPLAPSTSAPASASDHLTLLADGYADDHSSSPVTLYTTLDDAIDREIIDPLAACLEDADYVLPGRGTVEEQFDVEAIADQVLTTYTTSRGGVAYGMEEDLTDEDFWTIVEDHAR